MPSLGPVHAPTRDGPSALIAGSETRVATINEYIKAFIWEPSITKLAEDFERERSTGAPPIITAVDGRAVDLPE